MKLLISLSLCLLLQNICFAETEMCQIETHFSPREHITDIIINNLKNTKQSVRLSLFGITSKPLTNQLVIMKQNGIDVQVYIDNRQSKTPGSTVSVLKANNIPVIVKKTITLEHNKIALIDETLPTATIITGSWNWSYNAEKQDNNLVIITSCPNIVKQYVDELDYIKQRDSL